MSRGRRSCLGAGVLVGLLMAVAACGTSGGPAAPPAPAPPAYDGPLRVAPDPALDLWRDPGAAGRAVTCDQPVLGETSTDPFTGGEVGETPASGLRSWRDDSGWPGFDGEMRPVRTEPDRVLFTYATGGRTLQAVVVHRGPAARGTGAGADGIAWYVESSARCDVVEYPDRLAESRGVEVWTDAAGRRISSRTISSHTSDGDCLVVGTRSLELPDDDGAGSRSYLRNTADYPEYVDESFRADVPLPADAVDSGFHRGDEHLWFASDGSRAYVGGPERVELWPRETQLLGCG